MRALDVVLEDHQIDHRSIIIAVVQQHARTRTWWVVRVCTLRWGWESCLNMNCAHRGYSFTLIRAIQVSRSAHNMYLLNILGGGRLDCTQ